jgi:1-acyl-sn-glycerol-3-phosphate acyltransferase
LASTDGPNGMSGRYTLFRRFMLFVGGIFLGFTIHGARKVPSRGPLIVAANHHRFFDPVFVCMAVPRRVQWMAKKELFIPPLRRFFHFLGSFPVDRDGGGRSAIRSALSYLSEGWALGIFPEGTRQKDRESGEAKSGAIMLATRSDSQILPVFIGKVPSLRDRLRGEKMHAYIGEPIKIDNTKRGKAAYRALADEVLKEIYALPREGVGRF